MADRLARLVTHGRATVEVAAAQDRHRLAMVEAATPRAVEADIMVAEAVVVVVTRVVEEVVTPEVAAEATPAADIVDTTRARSAS